jgi:superfamily II DNA or RNA helicase
MENDSIHQGMNLRLIDNPGIRGRTTGRTRQTGSFLNVEIEIGPNDRRYFRATQLEEDVGSEDPVDLFASRRFGRPEDLRRLLALSRMSGELTNVLYSMESSNTEFFAHQYKPVLKFIESPVGRLLIADEVGLGKTIEAVYIWQELQARTDARRLLVVCPSMLREKWKYDFLLRFGIDDATIMDAKDLYDAIEPVARGQSRKSFVAIASLEGLRVWEEDGDPFSLSARERFAGILKESGENNGEYLFDLVIIDEAHYLRNSSTASHQTAAMLRDAARNLILLSATPLQTKEENLFNLLKLLAPEHFTDPLVFLALFAANAKIVRSVNAVLYGNDTTEALTRVDEALADPQFKDDATLLRARAALSAGRMPALEERVEIGRSLEGLSLFSTYYTRSRKRDVFPGRVLRSAVPVSVGLNEYENSVYISVSQQIRARASVGGMIDIFGLISKQRQLTSSFYAAIRKWRQDPEDESEGLWEDFGILDEDEVPAAKKRAIGLDLDFDLTYLRENDSKYQGFQKAIREILDSNPGEKVVVFCFYRATIAYLVERLEEDGVSAISLVGGMGDERWKVLERFREDEGLRILVSSEVGSEGIDLQFCRYLFNYDLPWNPMKLEQRIGRLERIGQKAEKILIYNLFCPNTIEDRVVMRLYERIEIFRNSIGDLEDILGNYIEEISNIIIDPTLSSDEREERLRQSEQALVEQRIRNAELEERSIDLLGHGEQVLRSIERSYGMRRWVGPDDTIGLVRDFFAIRFPQTTFRDGNTPRSLQIELSSEARVSFQRFIETTRPGRTTSLTVHEKPVLCLFDPKTEPPRSAGRWERISSSHPLIQWIVAEFKLNRTGLHPASALSVGHRQDFPTAGAYVYVVQRWSAKGIKTREEQRFFLVPLGENKAVEGERAEAVMVTAAAEGYSWQDWESEIVPGFLDGAHGLAMQTAGDCYERFQEDFLRENDALCDRQERYVTLSFDRRKDGIADLIARLTVRGKTRTIPMHQGRIRNLEKEKDRKLERIKVQRGVLPELSDVSMGLIKLL